MVSNRTKKSLPAATPATTDPAAYLRARLSEPTTWLGLISILGNVLASGGLSLLNPQLYAGLAAGAGLVLVPEKGAPK